MLFLFKGFFCPKIRWPRVQQVVDIRQTFCVQYNFFDNFLQKNTSPTPSTSCPAMVIQLAVETQHVYGPESYKRGILMARYIQEEQRQLWYTIGLLALIPVHIIQTDHSMHFVRNAFNM